MLHHVNAVVDTAQQHALVAQGDTGISQHLAGTLRFCRHLVGVVEVGVDPDGVILLQHGAEFRSDALRADHGSAGAQADNLHMRYLAQTRDDVFQAFVAHHQGIAAGEQHVAHAFCLLDILQGLLDAVGRAFVVGLAGKAAARTVAAVHRAHVGDEEQHAVGIAVCQAWCGRVLILVQRVEQVGTRLMCLQSRRYALTADGVVRVVGVDQTQIIGSDGHAERLERLFHAFLLLSRQADVFLQFVEGFYSVSYLPFPVVPLFVGDVGKEQFSS